MERWWSHFETQAGRQEEVPWRQITTYNRVICHRFVFSFLDDDDRKTTFLWHFVASFFRFFSIVWLCEHHLRGIEMVYARQVLLLYPDDAIVIYEDETFKKKKRKGKATRRQEAPRKLTPGNCPCLKWKPFSGWSSLSYFFFCHW